MWLEAAFLLAATVQPPQAQRQLPDHVLKLAQIRRNVQESVLRAPDYACLETVERFGRANAKARFHRLDTLQLEVAVIGNKEVYGWPGAESFEDVAPAELVAGGTVSTGEFIQLLRAVFVGGTPAITWHGEEEIRGRSALRYDYELPMFGYRSKVTLAAGSGDVSLKGSFWADAETLELLRLESQANEIPPMLPLAGMTSRIDYGTMTVQGRRVWFPQTAEMKLVELSGQEARNRIEFSHCRQYTGTATLSFGDPNVEPAAAPRQFERIDLPPGVALELRLETAIDSARTGVGESITARLASDAVHKKKVLIPAGAVVKGRLRRLEKSSELKPHFVVGLEFMSIENEKVRGRFFGVLEEVQQVGGLARTLKASTSKSTNFSGGDVTQGFRVEAGSSEILNLREIPGVGSFFMLGEAFKLPKGMKMTWRTVELPKGKR